MECLPCMAGAPDHSDAAGCAGEAGFADSSGVCAAGIISEGAGRGTENGQAGLFPDPDLPPLRQAVPKRFDVARNRLGDLFPGPRARSCERGLDRRAREDRDLYALVRCQLGNVLADLLDARSAAGSVIVEGLKREHIRLTFLEKFCDARER